ncbi:MAG: hypothetical protein ACYCVN_04745 [Acidimicrobiales bacterium]
MGTVVLVVSVLGALGFWYLVLRSPGTQIGLRQALHLYRREQPASGVRSGTGLPVAGVYRYRTTGGEQLSVGAINRAFPPTTEMIVTDATCSTMKWEPLVQHMEGVVVCPAVGGGTTLSAALSQETIAGTQTTESILCPRGTFFLPPHPAVGERWTDVCQSAHQRVDLVGQVLGSSSVAVGKRLLPALHTRIALTFSGSETGTNPTDYWLSPGSGLVLRQRESVDLSQQAGPLGEVRYTESMAISLDSTTPLH